MSPAPTLADTREELADVLASARKQGRRIGFVPTMGALHEGHAALLREAARHADVVVASIFVNPMQFGPTEDLDRYPRTLSDDLELCAANGVAVVFAPAVDEMYPGGFTHGSVRDGVTVHPGKLATILDGESRPGHFDGVLTVVAKLFGLVAPDVAVFGQKDYQQLALIQALVRDLCLPLEIVGAETVREADGLALSSRNRYLEPAQREAATVLSRALRAAQERAAYGVPAARWAAMSVLRSEPMIDLDYLALTSVDLGEPPETGEGRILVAARLGATRLIDNMPLVLGRGPTGPAEQTEGPAKRDVAPPPSEASK